MDVTDTLQALQFFLLKGWELPANGLTPPTLLGTFPKFDLFCFIRIPWFLFYFMFYVILNGLLQYKTNQTKGKDNLPDSPFRDIVPKIQ